jgi:hypothetical protein
MSDPAPTRSERTLVAAEEVCAVLESHGARAALIGGLALAVHRFARYTEDLDLATDTDPFTVLREVTVALAARGFEAKLITPDAEDPLGGVVNVRRDDIEPIQIVNFYNPLALAGGALGAEAIRSAQPLLRPESELPVVDLAHLIALKLYAGGRKSQTDVLELLERNQPLDLSSIRSVCARHGQGAALERLLEELGLASPGGP